MRLGLIAILLLIPFLLSGDASGSPICSGSNLGEVIEREGCALQVGTQIVLGVELVDEFGHTVDCDLPRCYRCNHRESREYRAAHPRQVALVDAYTVDGTFNNTEKIKSICNNLIKYDTKIVDCRLGNVFRGPGRLVVRFTKK